MTIVCKSSKFSNLVSPVTNETLTVMLTVAGGRPLFFSKDAYFPGDYQIGTPPEDGPETCPYTGEPLVLKTDGDGYWYEGGFNPRIPLPEDEFLRMITSRPGVEQPAATADQRVESVPEHFDKTDVGDDLEQTDEALKTAEKVVTEFKDQVGLEKKTVVSMSKGKGRKRR